MKLVPYQSEAPQAPAAFLHSLQEVREFAEIVLQSEMFKDVKSAAQAVVKIARGRELGLGPMESLSSLHVVEGKVTMSAQLMAALAQRAGFRYKVTELTDQICRLMWYDAEGEQLGPSEFTMHDAHRAGLTKRQSWRKYPKAMLQARALAAGARLYAAAALLGVYDPDELAPDPPGTPMPPPPQVIKVESETISTPPQPTQPQPTQRTPHRATEPVMDISQETRSVQHEAQSASPETQPIPQGVGRHPSKEWHDANLRIRHIASGGGISVEEIRAIIRLVYGADASASLSAGGLNEIADTLDEGPQESHRSWLTFAIKLLEKAEYSEKMIDQGFTDASSDIWRVILLHRHLKEKQLLPPVILPDLNK